MKGMREEGCAVQSASHDGNMDVISGGSLECQIEVLPAQQSFWGSIVHCLLLRRRASLPVQVVDGEGVQSRPKVDEAEVRSNAGNVHPQQHVVRLDVPDAPTPYAELATG